MKNKIIILCITLLMVTTSKTTVFANEIANEQIERVSIMELENDPKTRITTFDITNASGIGEAGSRYYNIDLQGSVAKGDSPLWHSEKFYKGSTGYSFTISNIDSDNDKPLTFRIKRLNPNLILPDTVSVDDVTIATYTVNEGSSKTINLSNANTDKGYYLEFESPSGSIYFTFKITSN